MKKLPKFVVEPDRTPDSSKPRDRPVDLELRAVSGAGPARGLSLPFRVTYVALCYPRGLTEAELGRMVNVVGSRGGNKPSGPGERDTSPRMNVPSDDWCFGFHSGRGPLVGHTSPLLVHAK